MSMEAQKDDWGPLSSLPGNPMIWLLILSELLVFGAGLVGFVIARDLDPAEFAHAQDSLNRLAGAINTMVLITSGLCAALAVEARRRGKITVSRWWLAGAGALGLLFLFIKALEYRDKIVHGTAGLNENFITLYFLLTGFHAAHVILGLIILVIVGWQNTLENLETGAAFWHMVDLIWVILFPVVYLMR